MKKILPIIACIALSCAISAQIVINEISYNPPESDMDTLEYIELYNAGTDAVDLSGYKFDEGVTYTFAAGETLEADSYYLLVERNSAMSTVFGVTGTEWDGVLSNGGEDIILVDANGVVVDELDFGDGAPWPSQAEGTDGAGASIELCNVNNDNADGANWLASTNEVGMLNDRIVRGTPGTANSVTCETTEQPQSTLQITEILYNDPSQEDTNEFIEIHNFGTDPVSMTGLSFSSGVIHAFGSEEIEAGGYLVVSKFPMQIMNNYGVESTAWTEGGLSDGGEKIEIVDAMGIVMASVEYDDQSDWTEAADGQGYSITLCDRTADPNQGSSWAQSAYRAEFTVEGVQMYGNPGARDRCLYDVATVTATNAEGVNTFIGEGRLEGTVLGVNLRPGALQFTLIDAVGDGIAVVNFGDDLGYEVRQEDEITVEGVFTQFRGLAQIEVDVLEVRTNFGTPPTAVVVTELNEDTESQLVTLENVTLVDSTQWDNSFPGFNVDVTDGVNTYAVRIDSDVNVFGMGHPQGTFNVTGIGGQFDTSVPLDSGYQLIPRYVGDIDPYNEFVEEFPMYDIPTLTTEDSNGIADSLGRSVAIQGIVHGINYRPSGLQFWVIDEDNNGIGLFNGTGDLGYTFAEGDELIVKGTIGQFRGLTQINPAEIELLSSGNDLVTVDFVNGPLSEADESSYVTTGTLEMVDATQWAGDGSSFSFDMTDGTNTYNIFIDADTEFATMLMPPATTLEVTGVVSQFDEEDPLNEDYSIWVRYGSDLAIVNDVVDLEGSDLISVYPNPTYNLLSLDTELNIARIEILDIKGQVRLVITGNHRQIDISDLSSGLYIFRAVDGADQYVQRFSKM